MKIIAMKQKQTQSMLDHFEITLKMLNETMDMCLPTRLITKAELPGDAPTTISSTSPATEVEDT